jgi:hypothetical protein
MLVPITLCGVLIVPDLKHNLFSVKCMSDRGGHVNLSAKDSYIVGKSGTKIPIKTKGSLYNLEILPDLVKEEAHTAAESETLLWHRRLGHRNYADVIKVSKKYGLGIPKSIQPPSAPCDVCQEMKHTHASFKKSLHEDKPGKANLKIFEQVDVDLWDRSPHHHLVELDTSPHSQIHELVGALAIFSPLRQQCPTR